MSREILQDIIDGFSPEKFTRFFREKNRSFAPRQESFTHYNDEYFSDGIKFGEIKFLESEKLVVCAFKASQPLSERSGKKAQYEKGKKILKDIQSDAGIFIFYDKDDNFRFSLIYDIPRDRGRRDWSTFRRFTYFVSREFTNKTFLQRIGDGDFSTLESIKEVFSVEPVNKEFYSRIAMLFTKLAGGERRIGKEKFKGKGLLHLPSTTDDTLNKEFTIRLIGRLVFCWFLKKKHSESGLPLLSNELLSLAALMKNENYYHSILEPLFFETLNSPAEERKKKFHLEPWAHVPFLNGGLFSPDEHDFYEVNELGISEFINVLKVPDKWIKDILEVFETYNFTIDENTSVDVELAIDPEILGRIFENLLAEINPETGETARKATGSYYTPRPIVEYMVDESLKQYILTKVKISEDRISSLLSYSNEEIGLSESEKDSVLGALDVIKIIDPACGSGAFPMGILHKMLLILQKIDPDSHKWIERKLSQIENMTVRKELGKKLREENWNYVHKLGIIQSSIYGVDIQPIATEISRLRFFLSLVVDERVEDNKPNRGIDPLPNLEFKFVCANSLIPLAEEGGELFDNKEMAQQMQDIRDRYFKTDNARIKIKMKKDFENILKKGYSLFASKKQKQLLTYHPFDTNNICYFFDSKFMFGIDRFDIVIANPPYVRVDDIDENMRSKYKTLFKTALGKYDLYYLFFEKSFALCKKSGACVFISPNKFCAADSGAELRKLMFEFINSGEIISTSKLKVFKEVSNYPIISILKTTGGGKVNFIVKEALSLEHLHDIEPEYSYSVNINQLKSLPQGIIPINVSQNSFNLVSKLFRESIMLSEFLSISEGLRISSQYETEEKSDFEIVKQFQFSRYSKITKGAFISKKNLHRVISENADRYRKIMSEKILITEDALEINATIDLRNRIPQGGVYFAVCTKEEISLKCLLGILNSQLLSYIYKVLYSGMHMGGGYLRYRSKFLENLPVPKTLENISNQEQLKFARFVDVALFQESESADNQPKQTRSKEYERQIDQMVYKLYGLTNEEIDIIEGNNK